MARKFNPIFKSLVKDDNDLYGLCAYAVYKREKIGEIERFKKNNYRDPDDNFLESFHEQSMNKLDEYRLKGDRNCNDMIAIAIGKAVQTNPTIVVQTSAPVSNEPKERVDKKEKKGGAFWRNVFSSFVAKLLWAIFPIILLFVGLVAAPRWTIKLVKLWHPELIEEVTSDDSQTKTTFVFEN